MSAFSRRSMAVPSRIPEASMRNTLKGSNSQLRPNGSLKG
jgi:hypothetical protein